MRNMNYTMGEVRETLAGPEMQDYLQDIVIQRVFIKNEWSDRVVQYAMSHTRDNNTTDGARHGRAGQEHISPYVHGDEVQPTIWRDRFTSV